MPVFEDTGNNRCGQHIPAKEKKSSISFLPVTQTSLSQKTPADCIYSLFSNYFSPHIHTWMC